MVNLVVVHHDVVDGMKVDVLLQPADKFVVVRFPNGVYKGSFFAAFHQIGVVATAFVGRQFVAVEAL